VERSEEELGELRELMPNWRMCGQAAKQVKKECRKCKNGMWIGRRNRKVEAMEASLLRLCQLLGL
jgi:hypothetical protein